MERSRFESNRSEEIDRNRVRVGVRVLDLLLELYGSISKLIQTQTTESLGSLGSENQRKKQSVLSPGGLFRMRLTSEVY